MLTAYNKSHIATTTTKTSYNYVWSLKGDHPPSAVPESSTIQYDHEHNNETHDDDDDTNKLYYSLYEDDDDDVDDITMG